MPGRPGLFSSGLPVSRLSAAMHHRDNVNQVIPDGIQDCVGEDMNKNSTNLPIEYTPPSGSIASIAYRCVDGINETDLQAHLAFGVEIGCSFKLDECFAVELKLHSVYFFRSLTKASSPGIPVVCPDLSSCKRRFASETQRLWIYPSSAGSRLSTRRSASNALASLGSARASFAISSTRMCMLGGYQ